MAEGGRRRSLAQTVVGFSPEDSFSLLDDDRSFFGSDIDSGAESSDDQLSERRTAEALASDAEENLDETAPAPAGQPLAASGPGKRKHKGQDTTLSSLQDVIARVEQGCGCRGANCFTNVAPDDILRIRNICEELSDELSFVLIAGKLEALARRREVSHHVAAAQIGDRDRITFEYALGGIQVCKAVFLYAHSASEHKLKRVQSRLKEDAVTPASHGNEGLTPWHALTTPEASEIRSFISHYATIHGLPQPAAPRGHNKPAPTYLPCCTTKKHVHEQYMEAGGKVAYPTFVRLWNKQCSDIIIMKPKEDVCATCSDLQSQISRARTEEKRLQYTESLRDHINLATAARDEYRNCIQRAKDAIAAVEPFDTPAYEHFTFDFAQQATIPHHAREVGALYFKVPRRIQIFGIAAEAIPEQVNYIFDEHQSIGKDGGKSHGPNAVVSMIHNYLQGLSRGAQVIGLHCDNCCGQNKNRTMIAYLCWRTILGLNTAIELRFMRVGHTRCFVDGGFGFLKQKYRKSDVDTVAQLAEVVNNSVGFNQAKVYNWDWRAWDTFLAQFFNPVRNITKFQNFIFSSTSPGRVQMSGSTTLDDCTITVLKSSVEAASVSTAGLPPSIAPAGLSQQRAEYLYKEIRKHCHEENRDITCPPPAGLLPLPEEHEMDLA